MSAGETAAGTGVPNGRSRIRIIFAIAITAVVFAVGGGVGVWIYRDQNPPGLSGRVLVSAYSGAEEGGGCTTSIDGYRLAKGSSVSLYAKAANDMLGDMVTTTLNRGTFEHTATGMACVFTFTLPRLDRAAAQYRLTVTARKDSVDVRTHYWDFPAARIFDGVPIEVEV